MMKGSFARTIWHCVFFAENAPRWRNRTCKLTLSRVIYIDKVQCRSILKMSVIKGLFTRKSDFALSQMVYL
jgi:hypothetical protein